MIFQVGILQLCGVNTIGSLPIVQPCTIVRALTTQRNVTPGRVKCGFLGSTVEKKFQAISTFPHFGEASGAG